MEQKETVKNYQYQEQNVVISICISPNISEVSIFFVFIDQLFIWWMACSHALPIFKIILEKLEKHTVFKKCFLSTLVRSLYTWYFC